MLRTIFRVAMAAVLAAVALPAGAQQITVAVIDVQRVVTDSDPGKEALQKLQKLQSDRVEQGKRIQADLDSLRDQLAKQQLTLADDKLDELRKKAEDKQIEAKRFQDDAQRELEDARAKTLNGLEAKIMPVINKIGKEKGYTLIFNKYQSGLVFADEAVDITDEVIRRFNTAQ